MQIGYFTEPRTWYVGKKKLDRGHELRICYLFIGRDHNFIKSKERKNGVQCSQNWSKTRELINKSWPQFN